jgi:mannose-6-phosphate isomerase-like protein (cupin superfamily)
MDDGAEEEFGRGDVLYVPPGHNAWVVSNEPLVDIDFTRQDNDRNIRTVV